MKLSSLICISIVMMGVALADPACTCKMPSSIRDGFDTETSPVYKAAALSTLNVPDDAYTWTVFEVKVVFRGCSPRTSRIVVKSPKTAAGCGVQFVAPYVYLLTLRKSGSSTPPPSVAAYGLDVYSAVSCNCNKLWDSVPYNDQLFLYYSPVTGC